MARIQSIPEDTSRALQAVRAWLVRLTGRWSRSFLLAATIGIAAGLAAASMDWGLEEGRELLVRRFTAGVLFDLGAFRWELLILPAIGALASGLFVAWLSPGTVEHGTDALTRAFHRGHGDMALRGPVVRAVAAVGVISSGGSAGPEGPIAALGASIGSTIGRWLRVTARERRLLLVAGCAAGVGAIFRSPLGGALFAVSIPYSEPEYESEAMVPSVVASVIGYTVFTSVRGFGEPLLEHADRLQFSSPSDLLVYLILGLACGVVSILFGLSFRSVDRHLAHGGRVPTWLEPAVGGLATGGIACLVPAITDSRYELVQAAMDGSLFGGAVGSWWPWAGLFGAIVLAKVVATSLTVGSGASGGLLGPSLFLGGVTGACLGASLDALSPGAVPEPLRQALIPVGMGGVLAATMRVPVAAIIMAAEMTGSYRLIVPLMLVCMTAYVVGRRWGLNDEQVPTSAESPVHAADAIVHLLEAWRVRDFLDREWPHVIGPATLLRDIVVRVEPGTHPVFAVVDSAGGLRGIVSVPDLDRIEDPWLQQAVVAEDIMTRNVATLPPDADLYSALELFRRGNYHVLPVVAGNGKGRWLGMLTRARVFEALRERIETSRRFVLEEYAALMAIDQEAELDDLLRAVSPKKGRRIERLMVPVEALGRSLRECDFRRQFGLHVVGMELADGTLQVPPDADRRLEGTERLLAIR